MKMVAKMPKHAWVEIKYTSIDPIKEADESISVYATEAAIEIGEEDVAQGCWICGITLDTDSINKECPGQSI